MKVFEYTLARTGMNAAMLEKLNISYESTLFITTSTPGYYPDPKELIVEIYFDIGTKKLLGAEIFGEKGVDHGKRI